MIKTIFIAVLFGLQFFSVIRGQGEWQEDLYVGDCDNAKPDDLVLEDQIDKRGGSDVREAVIMWHDEDFRVSCVIADNLRPNEGARVRIKDGGIGEDWVSVDMQSTHEEGFDFNITIYAARLE